MLTLCEKFGCLPSQLYAEDAGLFRLMKVAEMGGFYDKEEGDFGA